MHALDWIAEHGRFLRTISADKLRRELGRQRGECTWCGQPVAVGRIRYCSSDCRTETLWRISPQSMFGRRERRKEFRCARCGLDLLWLAGLRVRAKTAGRIEQLPDWCVCRVWHPDKLNRRGRRNQRRVRRWARLWDFRDGWHILERAFVRAGYRDSGANLWEWDHETPVIEGGGLCGEDGFRPLCIRCHRAATAELAARRAAARRPPKAKSTERQAVLF